MKVNPIVMRHLSQMNNITSKERKQLETSICRYSKPKTFSDTMAYIAYRIANAVKSIFGQSDRQISIRIIEKEVGNDKHYPQIKKIILGKVKASGIKSNALQDRIHNRLLPLISQGITATNHALYDHLINLNNGLSLEAAQKIVEKKLDLYGKQTKNEKNFIKKSFGLDLA